MNIVDFPRANFGRPTPTEARYGAYFTPANLPRLAPDKSSTQQPDEDILARAIALNGPHRVIVAALAALLRPRARPPDLRHLSPHILRDIGYERDRPPLPSERLY